MNALIASSGGSSGGSTTVNKLVTSQGTANLNTKATYTARQLAANYPYSYSGGGNPASLSPKLLIFRGNTATTSNVLGEFRGVQNYSAPTDSTITSLKIYYMKLGATNCATETVTADFDLNYYTVCEYAN